ncbi:hypothetical protein [Thermococcus guaymasensis]|uniref:hypothetical protein n=1 Tax=Thermococcus guaymasensis TaxID=110164 RepID=UPI001FE011BC|nr:hypothetical protein [Thermococcus guaymasensis]
MEEECLWGEGHKKAVEDLLSDAGHAGRVPEPRRRKTQLHALGGGLHAPKVDYRRGRATSKKGSGVTA